jgi:hypothetical protein
VKPVVPTLQTWTTVDLTKSRGNRITMANVSSKISKLKETLKIIFKI